MRAALFALATASVLRTATARNFVRTPQGVKSVISKNYPGASISYKATDSLCEITPGVKSYSGHVHLPSPLLADVPATGYNVSIFFWYFEARNSPAKAPLSIYLSGGPGESSLDSSSGFPCHINPDSNGTTLNQWSWNTNVNILYIDQPITTGFSYSVLVNGIISLLDIGTETEFLPVEDLSSFTQTNVTVAPATISYPDPSFTVNTTAQAARMLWHFAQVWFQDFPEYTTSNKEISIWTNSYGGYFAPAIFAHFERQNDKITDGSLSDSKAVVLNLDTIGLTNACIDAKVQVKSYPEFAYNNTYGIKAFSEEIYNQAKNNYTKEGGCRDLIDACRAAGEAGDSDQTGRNETVNTICSGATQYCFGVVQGAFTTYSNLNPFDITLQNPTKYPLEHSPSFYNQPWVQSALGVPLNYTLNSNLISNTFFFATGDPMRRTYSDLEFLLQRGKTVAMVYGDRDYRCSWTGAEEVSIMLRHGDVTTSSSENATKGFKKAGYEDITTNASYFGGVVRQHGGLSFSRVYDAGHSVAAYQPETVWRIFERVMGGMDVATGGKILEEEEGYSTKGPGSSFGIGNKVPEKPIVEPTCLVYLANVTCTVEQVAAMREGRVRIVDWVVIEPGAGGGGGGGDGDGDGDGEGEESAAVGRLGLVAGRVRVVALLVAVVVPSVLIV